MPFSLKLLKINFQNTYYTGQGNNDFYLTADEQTQHFMESHNMRILTYGSTYELVWLTTRFDNPLEIFKQKLAEHDLTFYLRIKNPNVVNFSLLNLLPDQMYYFSNTNSSQNLHKQEYVSKEDLIPIKPISNTPEIASVSNVFGIVRIHLKELINNKIDIQQLPIQYNIRIKAREAIWRYHIVDAHNRIKGPMKVVIDKDDSYFMYKGTLENKNIHIYESKNPLVLQDKVNQAFCLKVYPNQSKKNTASQEEVLLEKLPLPDVSLIENNVEKGGVFYSNIVVYV